MWLLVSAAVAIAVTYAWLGHPGQNRLSTLALAFWGLTFCVFVDHTVGWVLEGGAGPYFEVSADAFCLSIAMTVAIFAVWELVLLIDRLKANRSSVGTVRCAEQKEE